MLYGTAYHQAKAGIMRPISEFYGMMDQRTLRTVHDAENAATGVRIMFIGMGMLFMFTLWNAYRALNATLGCSVDELQDHIARLGSGDFSSPIPVAQGRENSVLGWLSATRAKLAQIDTRRREAEDNVRRLAFYDQLTELPNRRLFDDRLKQAMLAGKRSGSYGALMFLDLDNFKQLNDAYGHAVGDSLLVEVAQRLRSCVRELDTVARFGGDEFIVMLVDLSSDKAESIAQTAIIAEKIRARLAEPYDLTIRHAAKANSTIEYRCAASIGVTMFIKDEPGEEQLLMMADSAMYRAKESGRNMIRFADS
jgi:diguanylate cyclase (GGDEF)-like protein